MLQHTKRTRSRENYRSGVLAANEGIASVRARVGYERRALVLRNESAFVYRRSEHTRSLGRMLARACAARCNLSVVGPRIAPRSVGGVSESEEVEGSSSIIGITGLPRASSCLVGSARRRSAGSVRRRQSRSSSRALRILLALRSISSVTPRNRR